MKVAIVVGHNSASQGAVRKDTSESEYFWNSRLARMIDEASKSYGLKTKIFYRTPGGGYTREIKRVYAETDAWDADVSIELHFNSSADASATGTETLTSGTPLSMLLAQEVNDEMVRALGLHDRGIKTRSSSNKGRGYQSLIAGDAPAILVEPYFGSSVRGQKASDEEHEQSELAHAILRGAYAAMERFPRNDLSGSRTLEATGRQRSKQSTQAKVSVAAVAATAANTAKEQIAELPAIGALSEYLPYITIGLVAVIFISTIMSRKDTEQIEEARIDDHERRMR